MSNCSEQQIHDAAQSHIIIDSSFEMKTSLINPHRVGRRNQMEFRANFFLRLLLLKTIEQLRIELHNRDDLDRQTLQAYDAIWVVALLIRRSIERK